VPVPPVLTESPNKLLLLGSLLGWSPAPFLCSDNLGARLESSPFLAPSKDGGKTVVPIFKMNRPDNLHLCV
jgi:hypothetical protein